MSAILSSPQISGSISATLTNNAGSSKTTTQISHQSTSAPTIGSGSGAVNGIYDDLLAIADSSTPTTVDLTTITPTAGSANISTFATVNYIKITNTSAVAGQDISLVTVTNFIFFETGIVIRPGGSFTYEIPGAGLTVDSTHKLLKLSLAAGTAVSFKITVLGK